MHCSSLTRRCRLLVAGYRPICQQTGATLLELIVAMGLTTLVAIMILGSYTFAYELFGQWDDKSDILNNAVLIQGILERETSQSDSIRIDADMMLTFYNPAKGPRVFQVRDSLLFCNNRPVSLPRSSLEIVALKLTPPIGYLNTYLLEWRIQIKKRRANLEWLGGMRTGID